MSNLLIVGIPCLLYGVIQLLALNYFQEKAKNIATKQDITDITHKVEAVKVEYLLALEKFKADLHFQSEKEREMRIDAKNSLLNFYDAFALYYSMLDESRNEFEPAEWKALPEYRKEVQGLAKKVEISIYRVALYIEDPQIHELCFNLQSLADKVWHQIDLYLIKAEFILKEMNELDLKEAWTSTEEQAYKVLNERDDKLSDELSNKREPFDEQIDDKLEQYVLYLRRTFA